ncbi:Hypothetical predicted protein [Mytilus galloprovincialis]|uniref:Integrase catalytic domain-containing protein n=1 Tax=Mytilus galloprovincialis TaxID=29158 RepID=A0A8B6FLI6_MYTGA|nr:Hypothetical predicted protein [Mytilus galloprovincialis]
MPFGITSAPEEYQRRQDQAVEGIPGVKSIIDDILIYGEGKTEEEAIKDHDRKFRLLMERCRERNLKLNKDKLKLKMKEVKFIGHLITNKSLKMDPEKVRAVLEMPKPTDVSGVRRLVGFVTYLSKFLPKLSHICEPLRKLTLKDSEFCWLENHDKALTEIKTLVTSEPVLKYYDPNMELTLQSDASETGLGAAILQENQPIAYASHHKPLESILKKPLHCAPKRLQRMMLQLQKYNIQLVYKPGKEMYLADTLSRAYLKDTHTESESEEIEAINMIKDLAISEERLKEIQQNTETDTQLQKLKHVIQSGWPDIKSDVSHDIHIYFDIRDELTVQNGLIFKGERVIIPKTLRSDMIRRIHSSHIGVEGCLRRARESLYWPGLNSEVKDFILRCETCRTYERKQRKEPLISHEVPLRPWAKVAQFARYGIPDTCFSDNGPQFNCVEFRNFAKEWDFSHETSSPYYPQSNGKVEHAVQTAKSLMRKGKHAHSDPFLAILDFRNTPTQGFETSPAQRLMNRRTKTLIPTKESLLKPKIEGQNVQKEIQYSKERQAHYYNQGAKELSSLKEGDVVRVEPTNKYQKSWEKGTVNQKVNERSYEINIKGKTFRRNRNQMNSRTMNNLIMWNNKKIAIITLIRIKVRNKTHWTITQL